MLGSESENGLEVYQYKRIVHILIVNEKLG